MKFLKFIFMFIIIAIVLVYAFLWLSSFKKYPVDYGISFSIGHSIHLGLDWKKVYNDILTDLKPKYLRLSAPWSDVEKEKDQFDFSNIDYMMSKAEETDTKVTLVIGQKSPRWPECHVPKWTSTLSRAEYQERLLIYIEKVVKRYQNNLALEYWQVENEPFINFQFGDCQNFRSDLVDEEINLVNYLDPPHWVIVTDSGELGFWKKTAKYGDIFGTTLYRIVRTPKGLIWSYDWLPASFYRFKAIFSGIHLENMYVSELQAEPWFTGVGPTETPLEEQMKTMNIKRLNKHVDFVEKIGVSRAYLWGVEWWYWMAEKHDDKSYVDFAKNLLIK